MAGLNERGREDLVLVDELDEVKKRISRGKKYQRYYDKDFLDLILQDEVKERPEAIIHMGACSSTTLQDARYLKRTIWNTHRSLAQWALKTMSVFFTPVPLRPMATAPLSIKTMRPRSGVASQLNLYGRSKQDFDLEVLEQGVQDKVAGLKFFNVFGPNEYHKGDMRSVVAKAYQRVAEEGKIALLSLTGKIARMASRKGISFT